MTLDDELVGALRKDYKSAPISDQDRAMLDFVVQLTKDATKIGRADHEKLHAAGFDDKFIYDELYLPFAAREISMTQLMREESLLIFTVWKKSENKTEY